MTGPRSAAPDDDPSAALAARLAADLSAEAPDAFAGLAFNDRGVITIYATGDGAVVRGIVERVRDPLPTPDYPPILVLVARANSLATLERVRGDISERRDELEGYGIRVREWGVDIHANKTRIGVEGLTPEGEMLLQREFGADRVYVEESGGWSYTSAGGANRSEIRYK